MKTDALFLGCVLAAGLMVAVTVSLWIAKKCGLLDDNR